MNKSSKKHKVILHLLIYIFDDRVVNELFHILHRVVLCYKLFEKTFAQNFDEYLTQKYYM